MKRLTAFITVIFLAVATGFYIDDLKHLVWQDTKAVYDSVSDIEGATESSKRYSALEIGREVVQALHDRDMARLASFVHPEDGVRLSPYRYINAATDIVFSKEQVRKWFDDSNVYKWGHYQGSGEPIELEPKVYFDKFIYDCDYIHAEKIALNEALGRGNMINNVQDEYPDGLLVEYHFSGFDPALEGMDWRSLRLIFEPSDDKLYLVGIIHDQWTI